jgi:AraC-like DNA-binding protein
VIDRQIEELLRVHDDLIASVDTLERRLAQISLLRAAFISGHHEWPEQATRYLHEILQCQYLPLTAKEQALHLWAFRALRARRHPEDLQQALELLAQSGIDTATLQCYRLVFSGVDLAAQYRLSKAIETLRESATAFSACGHRFHVEWVERYLMGLYYTGWQLTEFQALLKQTDPLARDRCHGDSGLQFFHAVDAWNHGEDAALERVCAGTPPEVPRHEHALLPGPYLMDYQPACIRVIADRARDAPVNHEVVDLFVDMLHRLMLSIPVTIASVCLAQHVWLATDRHSLARLCTALQALGAIGEAHALLLSGFLNVAADVLEADQALDLLDRAWLLREPLTTPYYVVIAARILHEHGIRSADAIERLRNDPRAEELPIRARWVIEAAALALGAEQRSAMPPEDVRRAVTAQVHGSRRSSTHVAVAMDAPVSALKQLIDRQWFEAVKLDAFARTHRLSRFAMSRRFKTALGRSPRQYLQETRIHQAKRKLVETDWTMTDIAFECGFADAAQFSRLFKRTTGMTPVGYRASMGCFR